jgi:two-component system, OmpR family, sensor histidine kinase TctE
VITIRRRLLLMLLPALVILMLVGGLVDYWVALSTTTRAYDRALASAALALSGNVRMDNGRVGFAPVQLDGVHAAGAPRQFDGSGEGATLYSVRGPDQQWLAGTSQLPPAPGSLQLAVGRASFWGLDFERQSWRISTLLVMTSGGPVQISVAETLQGRARAQRVMLLGKLLVDFAELDLTLLLIWIAVSFGLRPLGQLTSQVEQQTSPQMQPLDATQAPGELRPVIVAFNRVLELLQDAAQAQQRFVADAAHQMRTPVAGLLAQIELLLKEPDAAAVGPQIAILQQGIQQLARSANQMLALARADPLSGVHEQSESVALKPLVEQLVERQVERADRAGIDLGAETHPASVPGNAWLLEDLLENLLDNALKYTPTGGHVTVRCGMEERAPYLEVEDDGPGIPESERARVRERFYRRPGAPGIGCGLGLAIVDQIARAHDAGFMIATGTGGVGTRMRVRFGKQGAH